MLSNRSSCSANTHIYKHGLEDRASVECDVGFVPLQQWITRGPRVIHPKPVTGLLSNFSGTS